MFFLGRKGDTKIKEYIIEMSVSLLMIALLFQLVLNQEEVVDHKRLDQELLRQAVFSLPTSFSVETSLKDTLLTGLFEEEEHGKGTG